MAIQVLDIQTDIGRQVAGKLLADLRLCVQSHGPASQTVSQIIADVRTGGDEAVVKYMRQWTDPDFSADRIVVSQVEMQSALASLDPKLRGALQTAIDHVREYQTHIMPRNHAPLTIDGAQLGLRFSPIQRVGLAVPGGRAAYPSSVIMLAVPALVAGVPLDGLRVVSPPPTRRAGEPLADISPLVLATCALIGIRHVYRIGGAQAMAALALGTKSVQSVDLIAGPGNIYTQLAKQQLMGQIGIDGFYGPSEIVTIADESARPDRVAADLIAQAEHDPGRCILVSWSRQIIAAIDAEISRQIETRLRRPAIEAALAQGSAAILVRNENDAVEIADLFAAEHVNLAVRDPQNLLQKLKHGGEFFLGDAAPVAAGDYFAGPSHCLPTGTTARFSSGISVYTFLKRSGTVFYPQGMSRQTIDAIALLAEAEGLDGHAHSVRVRGF